MASFINGALANSISQKRVWLLIHARFHSNSLQTGPASFVLSPHQVLQKLRCYKKKCCKFYAEVLKLCAIICMSIQYSYITLYFEYTVQPCSYWSDNVTHYTCNTTMIKYRKTINTRRTKSQNISNINDSRLVLQLALSNPLKPGVKSRMKM